MYTCQRKTRRKEWRERRREEWKKKKFSELTLFPSFSQILRKVSPAHAPEKPTASVSVTAEKPGHW